MTLGDVRYVRVNSGDREAVLVCRVFIELSETKVMNFGLKSLRTKVNFEM